MRPVGGVKLTRKAAEGTLQAAKLMKATFNRIFGLGKKEFKFNSLARVPNQRGYVDDYGVYGFVLLGYSPKRQRRWLGFSIFAFCFGVSCYFTQISKEESLRYYYYTNYPSLMKVFDRVEAKIIEFDAKYLHFLQVGDLTDSYQYNAYKQRTKEQLFGSKQKRQEKDTQAIKMNKYLTQIDKQLEKLDQSAQKILK